MCSFPQVTISPCAKKLAHRLIVCTCYSTARASELSAFISRDSISLYEKLVRDYIITLNFCSRTLEEYVLVVCLVQINPPSQFPLSYPLRDHTLTKGSAVRDFWIPQSLLSSAITTAVCLWKHCCWSCPNSRTSHSPLPYWNQEVHFNFIPASSTY